MSDDIPLPRVLIKESFVESNKKFRLAVLESGARSRYGIYRMLVRKYRRWQTGCSEREAISSSESESEQSDDEGEDKVEDDWPKDYIRPYDDCNYSDDELDYVREFAMSRIVDCKDPYESMMLEMLRNIRQDDTEQSDDVIDSFVEEISTVKANNNSIYTLRIDLLSIKQEIMRILRVPAALSLSTFQEKVLCPLLEYLPNLSNYGFYLASNKYVDHEKPEEIKKDICITSVGMNSGFNPFNREEKRGDKHIVDDRRVALFHVLHTIDDYIYYKHGSSKEGRIPYKIVVINIEEQPLDYNPALNDIRVTGGRGPVPDEGSAGPSWDDPNNSDDEICGIKAFCISIEVCRKPAGRNPGVVKSARKDLRLQEGQNLDFDKFDVKGANRRIRQASHKMPIKKGTVTSDFVISLLAGHVSSKQGLMEKCMDCGKREHELGRKLLRCARCMAAYYCDVHCQKKDWVSHKVVCVKATIKR